MSITARQFEQLQQRLKGRRQPAPAFEAATRTAGAAGAIVLGIDPSLRGTGYGVLRQGRPQSTALAGGTITCPQSWERSRCLVRILETLRDVVKKHHPTICVVEGLFFAQNLQTALLLGEARGACLVAVAEAGLEIYEMAPRRVKQAIVGFGGAQKLAVAKMVQRLLRLPEPPAPDEADAYALALAYAQTRGGYSLTPLKRI